MSGLVEFIEKIEPTFNSLNSHQLKFANECKFAVQQISGKDYTLAVARKNQSSVKNAVENVAAIGISLNPATKHAYLVPRDQAIVLDISYMGLIKLATDTGIIKWARAQVVYEGDLFVYHGPATPPEYQSDPFLTPDKRGEFKGVYCIAKTMEGDILTDVMSAAEVLQIRDSSESMKSEKGRKYSPWTKYFSEMAKKTVIKRAYKTWPQSDGRDRLDKAVDVLNEHEGIEFESTNNFDDEQFDHFRNFINKSMALSYAAFEVEADAETWAALYSAYKKIWPGTVAELKSKMKELSNYGHDLAESMAVELEELALADNSIDITASLEELTESEIDLVLSKASPNTQHYINSINEDKAA